ncbi:MAG: hypothetical protein HY264_02860 [Chloroflexi bacterium]|nr:hypothetical protein [Chloroflexota bacterium]
MNGERLVAGYLDQLNEAAQPLSRTRRCELVAEVREHIAEDLARGDRRDEIAVRNVLERLGPPDAIVAAELAGSATSGPAGVLTLGALGRSLGVGEVLAVLLLTVGAVAAPVIGPAIGLVLMWASSRWSTPTKVSITLVAVLLLLVPVVLLMAATPATAPTP